MNNNRRSVLIGLIFLVIICVMTTLLFSGIGNYILTGSINGYSAEDLAFIKKIVASKKVLEERFYEDVSAQDLYDGAMSGMLAAVGDPYTQYLPSKANDALKEVTSGKYDGVGVIITIDSDNKFPEILYVLPDSPAEKAELKINDKILSINGTSCENLELDKTASLMKVEAGSKIDFLIKREDKEINISLETEEILIKSVYSENMDGIGYIQIASFDEQTSKEFEDEYKKLREENISGLIIDLRDNGGGVYEEAVKIAKTLVPNGLIVYTEDKNGVKKEEYSDGEGIDIPLVILVNENTASASEVLAGAIKDRQCGTLVGKTTYGKGVVQGWFLIGDGTSIKLTIAKYYTPSGICIDGTGILPDIEVEEGTYLKDLQLKKALDILKK